MIGAAEGDLGDSGILSDDRLLWERSHTVCYVGGGHLFHFVLSYFYLPSYQLHLEQEVRKAPEKLD